MFIELTEAGSNNLIIVMISHIIYFMPDNESDNTVIGLTSDVIFVVEESELKIREKILSRT
jgi:hypothetical protein